MPAVAFFPELVSPDSACVSCEQNPSLRSEDDPASWRGCNFTRPRTDRSCSLENKWSDRLEFNTCRFTDSHASGSVLPTVDASLILA